MEWNTDLDLTLRSLPWCPLRCTDQPASESRIFLAKFYTPPSDSTSCSLLLFDPESAAAFFEPVRASRLVRRCTRLPTAASSDPGLSGPAAVSSQEDSDFKVHTILASLQRAFSPHHGEPARYGLTFSVQCSRHATTLEICMNSTSSPETNFSFTFEADSLDHEQAASVFLNHWALPLLGLTSSLNRLLARSSANLDMLLPSMQETIDQSAEGAQKDHCEPIMEVFQSAFLSTSLTRWSETHLRREQPTAILAAYGSTEVAQPRQVVQKAQRLGSSAVGVPSPHGSSVATGLAAHPSSIATDASSQDASSSSDPNQTLPDRRTENLPAAELLQTSASPPQALKRSNLRSVDPTGHSLMTTEAGSEDAITSSPPAEKKIKTEDSISRDARVLYGGVAFQGLLPDDPSTSSTVTSAPTFRSPFELQNAQLEPFAVRPKRKADNDSSHVPQGTPVLPADAPPSSAISPPASPASPQTRPVMAPLRRGGAPARGTARARRF